jgi:high-affinity nickel-transport protein
MDTLPNDWLVLLTLVFTLGLKHGLDADHLAAIDGLARHNARANRRVARWCGLLFSLGHGVVVMLVALSVVTLTGVWRVPAWIEDLGALISIGFLLLIGLANLHAVLTTGPGTVVTTIAVKGRLLGGLQRTSNPLAIALVGALFAISFDTMSQAALFAVVGAQHGGAGHAAALGAAFTLGMLVTDGVNGIWIARLIRRADQVAIVASRVMGLAISLLGIGVGTFGLARYVSPAVAAWSEDKSLGMGLLVIVVIAVAFAIAVRVARPERANQALN